MNPQDRHPYDSGPPPQYQAFNSSYAASAHQANNAQNPEVSNYMPGAFPQPRQPPPSDARSSKSSDLFAAIRPLIARRGKDESSVVGSKRTLRNTSATATAASGGDENPEEIYIAIMGVTGSGKSQFIQLCSESRSVKIGHSLASCTQDVGEYSFMYREKRIHLIDTPGFDDTNRTDREVLDEIVMWFGTAYKASVQLTGILYLHRITDPRMAGTAFNNLKMFKKLCGQRFYPRVSLSTTFWDTVHPADGERREADLIETDEFWGRMVEGGSKFYRHHGGRESAMSILNSILKHRKDEEERNAPSYVQVQTEMAEENKTLDETSAGQEVNAKILEERKKFEKQLEEAKEDMKVALEENDRKSTEAIKKHREMIEGKLKKGYEDQEKLNVRLEDMQAQHMRDMEKLIEAIAARNSQIEALESQNREKEERLQNLSPQSSTVIALRREINENNDELKHTKKQLEADSEKFKQKKNVLTRAYEWTKRHPNTTAKAAMLAAQFLENVIASHRVKLAERHRNLSTPRVMEYEIVELDDDDEEPGPPVAGHSSPLGLIQDVDQAR